MRCVVPGCSNSSVSARLHAFPLTDRALCRTWLRSVQHPEFGADTDLTVVTQQRLRVCSDHFVAADYKGNCLKEGAVPSVFPWTGIRVEMLSQPLEEETSDKEDFPVATCSQMKEDPTLKAFKISQAPEVSGILKSDEVLVNTQCLLELFKCCSVCLVECCVTIEGNERLFSVTQDCQSCGHHRKWRSHPNSADEPGEDFHEEHEDHEEIIHKEHKDHERPFHREYKDHKESLHEEHKDEDAVSHPETVVMVPHRMKTKEVSMEIKQIIVSMRNEKKSIREIGKTLGLSKSTVGYILKKKASTGDVSNRKRPGRPRKATEEVDQIILSIMTKNPRTPVQQIKNTLKEVGREISLTTIRRKLHSLNHTIETAFLHNLKMAK
ncbi:uncharacterized protein LOC118801591 isoform X2 [Colossoma macropomum]|uniref:uncharacterized protein LOC118801591 isoform X2 n=1 Tax=Colossoma macropomum TaxID=42526 RepID=UPI00186482D3|nr:uncharacterized protein LOC118801591 isoform X2 [Colossoma macropomum]